MAVWKVKNKKNKKANFFLNIWSYKRKLNRFILKMFKL